MKKVFSILLSVLIITSAFVTLSANYTAASSGISYVFSGSNSDKAGYAEGKITLTAPAGTYWLYWADDNKALDGYYKIAKLTVSGSSASHSMHAQTAIPADATKLIAIKSSSEPGTKTVASASEVYSIPQNKLLGHKSSERLYRFEALSDIHIDAVYGYKYAEQHLSSALDTAVKRNADFIITSGDHHNNTADYSGIYAKEWKIYQRILADSNYCNPIYEGIGNHELWQGVDIGTKAFINATGLEGSNNKSEKAYYEKTINGDHFIFMALEGGFYPNEVENFSNEQLDWLEGLLLKYSGDGKNIYIIEHSLFNKYGAGDKPDSPYYDIPLSDDHASTRRFKSLLEEYKDSIFISGHTHIAFSEQYNYSDNGGTSAQMIHNSSCGAPRYIVNGSLSQTSSENETEGYIVDAFDNAIIFNGTNLYDNKYDPNCCYILKTSSQIYSEQGATHTQSPTQTLSPTSPSSKNTVPSTTTQSSYYLKGEFNNWNSSNPFYNTTESELLSTTLNLSAGSYKFKINTGSTWYGNEGVVEDTTKKTSNGGWVFTSGGKDCTLKASGGYYTFTFNTSTKKVNIYYDTSDPYATEATEAPATNAVTTAPPTEIQTEIPHTETETNKITETESVSETQEQIKETETEPETEADFILGDVNDDKAVNIKDATLIQKKTAKLVSFTEKQDKAADVNGDKSVNVKDATMIQKKIAGLIESFTASAKTAKKKVGAVSLATVKSNLDLYYRYSSYDVYQALKKEYFKQKDSASPDLSKLSTYESNLLSVVDPKNVDGSGEVVTVYFENTNNWSEVHAYVWGNGGVGSEKKWPGNTMTSIGKNEYNHKIYKYTVNIDTYPNIIFNNGDSLQTKDITIAADNICYYLSSDSTPYAVTPYLFKDSYIVQ